MSDTWIAELQEGFQAVADGAVKMAKAIVDAVCETFKHLDLKWCLAVMHASRHHPEWLTVYERTKKRRTKKKYRDRILRDYERSLQGV